EKEEVVAGQRPVRQPDELRHQDRGEHEPAEQAGPGLLEAEDQEFAQPARQAIDAAMCTAPRRLQQRAIAISIHHADEPPAQRVAIATAAPAITTLLPRLTRRTAFGLVIRRRAWSATPT